MLISFEHNGIQYSNWDTESEQFKNLKFSADEMSKIIYDAEMLIVSQQRKLAYQKEADPLYLEWQYDQTPEKEQIWRDKVEDIKHRFPLPEAL